ncbi:MAG TPA: DUF1501 domain-containing protein [Aggregatilineales bacterium]|nr:DUF1501 domain-containing protein [Aggregatilineales bacterium]
MNRRSFLKSFGTQLAGVFGVSSSLFPAWMPKMAFSPQRQRSADHDVLVVIFQRGGMDGLNAVVPFGEGAHYYDRRPSIAIPEPGAYSGAIDLDGFFGFHPALASLKDVFDAGHLAVIHGAGSPDPTRSHFDAMEYMERGIPGDRMTSTGWITRHLQLAAWQNDSPFRAIGMGAMLPSSLRGEVSAVALRSIADFHLDGRSDQLRGIQQTLARLYRVDSPADALNMQASNLFEMIEMLGNYALEGYTPSGGAAYPETEFGLGLMQTAQLIKADIGLEVSCINIGGWDTHDNQGGVEGQMAGLLTELAQGLSAFYSDMGDLMVNVTVVTMSEFGRTTSENASGGTDHGRASVMFVMGGGLKGGMYANWQGLHDDALEDGDLAVTTDYRDILGEILTNRLGSTALPEIFPGYTYSPSGIIIPR